MIEILAETSLERNSQDKCSPGDSLRRDRFICSCLVRALAVWGDIKNTLVCVSWSLTQIFRVTMRLYLFLRYQYMPLADIFCFIIKGLREFRDERNCSYFLQRGFESWSFTALWEGAISRWWVFRGKVLALLFQRYDR